MFGFSLMKLLVLVLIVAAVWYGFKLAGRRDRLRAARRERDRVARRDDAQDMTRCAVCGTFVPLENAHDCGRDGCPYPG